MKYTLVFLMSIINLGLINFCQAQFVDTLTNDTIPKPEVRSIEPVKITAYFSQQPLLGFTAAGHKINSHQLSQGISTSLLPGLNRVAGLKMEERSPGSYRVSLRGSMLRSPFGVRNTKIYYDEFSLTDAGGNTYLNVLNPQALSSVEIMKGPDGSIYGANSGGVIRFEPAGLVVDSNELRLGVQLGSFGQKSQSLSIVRKPHENYSYGIHQSWENTEGYRDHTQLKKITLQTAHRYAYSDFSELKFLFIYTDLFYETPGGLTESQWKENPKMSRPAAGINPGSAEQNASIHNKTLFSGINHLTNLSPNWDFQMSMFGSYTDFSNPFISNYENRYEYNVGLRSFLAFRKQINTNLFFENHTGLEGQKGWYNILNYDNLGGIKGNPQNFDQLQNFQKSYFNRAKVNIYNRLNIEASLGLNQNMIGFKQNYPLNNIDFNSIYLKNEWVPRFATSYLLNKNYAIRASVSKGYSPPTIAELRPSNQVFNPSLKAEYGYNYEIGMRYESKNREFIADLSAYNFNLKDGIVRQVGENSGDYFVNAGEISQKGLEFSIWSQIFENSESTLKLEYEGAITYQEYTFLSYKVGNSDFSGNRVTAVPNWMWNNVINLKIHKNLEFNIIHHFTSNYTLNDAATVWIDPYHLMQIKMKFELPKFSKGTIQLWTGADNLLNENYSLGNDINAFGNRFYNPAPKRNYSLGINWVY